VFQKLLIFEFSLHYIEDVSAPAGLPCHAWFDMGVNDNLRWHQLSQVLNQLAGLDFECGADG
jgi:hypothetical protein